MGHILWSKCKIVYLLPHCIILILYLVKTIGFNFTKICIQPYRHNIRHTDAFHNDWWANCPIILYLDLLYTIWKQKMKAVFTESWWVRAHEEGSTALHIHHWHKKRKKERHFKGLIYLLAPNICCTLRIIIHHYIILIFFFTIAFLICDRFLYIWSENW